MSNRKWVSERCSRSRGLTVPVDVGWTAWIEGRSLLSLSFPCSPAGGTTEPWVARRQRLCWLCAKRAPTWWETARPAGTTTLSPSGTHLLTLLLLLHFEVIHISLGLWMLSMHAVVLLIESDRLHVGNCSQPHTSSQVRVFTCSHDEMHKSRAVEWNHNKRNVNDCSCWETGSRIPTQMQDVFSGSVQISNPVL